MHDRVAVAPSGPTSADDAAIVERARRRGFHRFVVGPHATLRPGPSETFSVRDGARLRLPNDGGETTVQEVRDLSELERRLTEAADGSTLALEWTGDRVIPLEWAVARRGRRFRLWTFARTVEEVPAALGALEHGADTVVAVVRTPEEVDRLEALLDRPPIPPLPWAELEVDTVRPAGMGDRVIVDTTSLLAPEEGLLVGSTAAFLFHVASEAVGSTFSRPRPFRVNAGAAHSYVLMADGTTRYLSELSAGDAVLVAAPSGASRPVRVGRIKVERRPLTLIGVKDEGRDRTVFLQEAETVRLSSAGLRVAVTELSAGRRVWGVRLPPGRHLGVAVEETVEER